MKLARTVLLVAAGTALVAVLRKEIPAVKRYVKMERM
jgi:hypothetical protein